MFKEKSIEKKYLDDIINSYVKIGLNILPGSAIKHGRYVWCLLEIGRGSLKSGFSYNSFCKGIELDCLEKLNLSFIKDNLDRLLVFPVIVRVILREMGLEIRREFQLISERIIPVSRYWMVRHLAKNYKIIHLKGREENAIKYEAELLKEESEKIKIKAP